MLRKLCEIRDADNFTESEKKRLIHVLQEANYTVVYDYKYDVIEVCDHREEN